MEPTNKNTISNNGNANYLTLIAVMFLVAVAGTIAIETFRPDKDNSTSLVTIWGSVSTTTAFVINFIQGQETRREAREAKEQTKLTHELVNSNQTKQIADAIASARAEWLAEGEKKGRDEADARTDVLKAMEKKFDSG